MRISGHRTAAFWSKVFAPLVTDRRENPETIDMIEAPDGSVSIWQGLERVEDPGGADGAMAQPGGDIRFILPQLWFGDRVCGILHGCAMEWHGKTFALLGKSGAGKSTLAAHLASQGARYVSDDLLFLLDDGTVPRLVMPPSIKIGAWDLVSPHFPALQTVPSFLKGETAFRLMPDAPFISEEAGDMPQHFFFLGFTAGRVLAVDQIDLDEVFLRLSSVGLWVRNGRLAEITGMLRPAKWHWLRHGDSAEAGEAIAGILDS